MRWIMVLVLLVCACGDDSSSELEDAGELEDGGKLEGGGRVVAGRKPGKVPARGELEDAGELEGGAIDGGGRQDAASELEAFTGAWSVVRTTMAHDCPSSVPVMDQASTWDVTEAQRGALVLNLHQATVPGELRGMRTGATWSASTADGAQLAITLSGTYAGDSFTASESSTLNAGAIVCTIHRNVMGRRK